ncbi:MAG TPA: sigma factor-like helix-turn-helix DNA-binding protein [Segetibacter sp.]
MGEQYALTRERVRQIKEMALNKLRILPKCTELGIIWDERVFKTACFYLFDSFLYLP